MSWHDPETRSAELGPLQALAGQRVDLHALWAGASRLAGYRVQHGAGGERVVTVMVELAPTIDEATHRQVCALIHAPPIYAMPVQQPLSGPPSWPRFITGTLTLAELQQLAALSAQAGGPVRRWRLGLPQVAAQAGAVPAAASAPVPGSLGTPLNAQPATPWIGIIDHGFGLAHRAFRGAGATATGPSRLALMWDQDPTGAGAALQHWRSNPVLGYGACLTGSDVAAALSRLGGDEMAVYRHFGYQPAQHRSTHGTHVLDLAAGWPHPLCTGPADPAPWSGCAGQAPLIAVQLPHRPNKDTSGAGLGVQVLDALHFIAAHARENGPRADVVVNLSDGAYGGRHDGRSMTEEAIDDFLRTHPHVQLVVAAGNAGDQHLHASTPSPLGPGAEVGIDWQVLPDDTSDSFCEVWVEGQVAEAGLALVVEPPGGLPAITVALGSHRVFRDPGAAGARCAVLSTLQSVNHWGAAGFLVAVGATSWPVAGRALAPHGRWRLRLRNTGSGTIPAVHLWVERDNPVGNERGPRRQSRLMPYAAGGPGAFPAWGADSDEAAAAFAVQPATPQSDGLLVLSPARTLSSLAGGQESFVVGGYGLRGLWPATAAAAQPLSDVPPYVSRGPGRVVPPGGVDGPDIAAPCDDSPSLPGLLAAGTRSGTRVRMSGTSVAAPWVTRWLAELVSRLPAGAPPDRAALRAALQRCGAGTGGRLTSVQAERG